MDHNLPPKERLKKLFEQGGKIAVDNNVPIGRYFRSGQEMTRMANIYFEEKQYESAYLLFVKFITLFFEKLKAHPQYKQAPVAAKTANKISLKIALTRAEKTKAILEEKYEVEYMKWKADKDKLEEIEQKRINDEKQREEERRQLEGRAMLEKEKHQMDYFVEQQRRKQLEEERLAIEARFSDSTKLDEDKIEPLIPVDFAPPPSWPTPVVTGTQPQPNTQSVSLVPKPLQRPTVNRNTKPSQLPGPASQSTTPSPSVSNDIPNTVNYGGASTRNTYGLRTVVSPQNLPEIFMQYARDNTVKNIETCGVLFGNLSQNMFVITHVLLPHQTGTSESCTTTHEEDLWEFQERYDGICLGWIHTHPSQTAFLSSVDLHTHYPYQCLMAESVAIVCSGKFNETGYFMITPGRGMSDIGGCRKVGHHPHQTTPPLFEACNHVKVSENYKVELIDWRKR